MKQTLTFCLAFISSFFAADMASAQCTYTTIKDGSFSDASIYAVTGTGCATTPAANSTVIINNKVVLDKNFSSTGALSIGATGSLVQDAANRTLTFNNGSLTIAATVSRGQPQLQLSVLDFTKTTATIGANAVVQVNCTLFTGNQTTVNLGNNSLLNVLGNVDVGTGNPGIAGPAAGTPAGLRISGNIVNNSGGGAKLFQTTNLVACVQGNAYPSGCSTASSNNVVTPPASNDPTCFTVLPVTLTRFAGSRASGGATVSLSWATATELNNAYFAIERSATGAVFETLGQVKGAGMSMTPRAYTYLDDNPLLTSAYYRLRQVDYDGTISYSPVVIVAGAAYTANWLVPASTPRNYTVLAGGGTTRSLLVIDALGRLVFSQVISPDQSGFVLPAMAEGVYFFRLRTAQGWLTARQALVAN